MATQVNKGQQLTDGVVIPHEILEICGVRELQKYLVNQVQEVYLLKGVNISDKHIEIIVRQMLKKELSPLKNKILQLRKNFDIPLSLCSKVIPLLWQRKPPLQSHLLLIFVA